MLDKESKEQKQAAPDKQSADIVSNSNKQVLPTVLEREMESSYLDYAMSVIVSRALPDVRDGLKPVHRRILFAMHDMGLHSSAKFRKSATVIGETLGKYHPHGDMAVYDAMVRMAQDFAMRYPLVKGQGNFGSIDGDPPAAMRYSEAKMAKITDYLLADIDKETIPFRDNFDGTKKEPSVLPARLPNLLINGSLGIAVGMATNILPHNLSEVIEAIIAQINNPDISLDELTEIIPGPDFPTGGNIYDQAAIKAAYATGRGPVVCRGTAKILEKKRSGWQIIISEIPYQVNKADLISKIAALVKTKRLEGISDIRDESDRHDGVRIVIDLKSNAFPKKILNQLYKLTPLQTTFHMNFVALVDGIQPRLLGLKEIIAEYIKHRQKVVRLRTEYELKKAKHRAHILAGLKKALDFIDEVIETIRRSPTKEKAQVNLVQKFKLTNLQAEAILEMKLSALAGLERQKVLDELAEKKRLIEKLSAILANPQEILKIIIQELKEIKERFGDARRTKIYKNQLGKFALEDLIPDEKVIITLTAGNYIKRVPVATYRSQHRGGKGVVGMDTRAEDTVKHLVSASTHDEIMFFTNQGKIFRTKVYQVPVASRTAKGHALVNVISLAPDEKVTALLTVPKKQAEGKYLVMATRLGRIKKTLVSAYKNVRQNGIIAIRLAPRDELRFVRLTQGNDQIILVTQAGQSIFFNETNIRPMGRSAAGVRGIKLRSDDEVIAAEVVARDANPDLITVLQNGYGKRTIIRNHFKIQRRGGLGVRASKVNQKTGKLVHALLHQGEKSDLVLVSQHGTIIRIPVKSVKRLGRNTQGVTLMRLKPGDQVASVGLIIKEEKPISADEMKIKLPSSNRTPKQFPSRRQARPSKKIKKIAKKKPSSKKSKIVGAPNFRVYRLTDKKKGGTKKSNQPTRRAKKNKLLSSKSSNPSGGFIRHKF